MNQPRPHVTYYVAASLDGFIATTDGGLDWLRAYENTSEDYGYQDLLRRTDCLIMGHRTYRHCRAMCGKDWPYAHIACHVMTSWPPQDRHDLPTNAAFCDTVPAALLDALAGEGRRRCWLMGGGETAGHFLRDGLIDEIILTTVPLALGSGIPLFGPDGHAPRGLFKHQASQCYANGLVQNHYRRGD
ncbi:dihydrofolate reductase family protein [Denitratisoma sp. agr-D3]